MTGRRRGRPRSIWRSHIEWTSEVEDVVMPILEAVASDVLNRMGLIRGRFVTRDDLVSYGYQRVYFYIKSMDDVRRTLFLACGRTMFRYAQAIEVRRGSICIDDVIDGIAVDDEHDPYELCSETEELRLQMEMDALKRS